MYDLKNNTKLKVNNMTKQEFDQYLDELTKETGWNFDKVYKAFAYKAAKHYHEQQVKNCSIYSVSKRCFCGADFDGIECNSCGFDASEVDIY